MFAEVKKVSKGLLIAAVVVWVLTMCACTGFGALIASSGNSGKAPVATQAPAAHVVKPPATKAAPTATPKPKAWHIVKKFTGNGSSQTPDFTVPGSNWRIVWSCNPASEFGGSYNVIADVDPTDGSIGDPGAINTICQAGNTSGTTNIHDLGAGTYYLNVMSEAAWTFDIETYS